MYLKNFFVTISLLSVFFSCSEKEGIIVPETDVPVITGYFKRDSNGEPKGLVGQPNTKKEILDSTNSRIWFFTASPIPAKKIDLGFLILT